MRAWELQVGRHSTVIVHVVHWMTTFIVSFAGTVQLAELDGPFVKLRLQGRFWHKRADVLARVAAYLQRRIPDIMEVDIEDDAQLDDSAAAFDHS